MRQPRSPRQRPVSGLVTSASQLNAPAAKAARAKGGNTNSTSGGPSSHQVLVRAQPSSAAAALTSHATTAPNPAQIATNNVMASNAGSRTWKSIHRGAPSSPHRGCRRAPPSSARPHDRSGRRTGRAARNTSTASTPISAVTTRSPDGVGEREATDLEAVVALRVLSPCRPTVNVSTRVRDSAAYAPDQRAHGSRR